LIKANGFNPKDSALFFTHKYHAAPSFIVDALAAVVPSFEKTAFKVGIFLF
jgi:hypothetical protein